MKNFTAVYAITKDLNQRISNQEIIVEQTWEAVKGDGFCADYSSFCSFKKDEKDYILGYDSNKQCADFYRLSGDGGIPELESEIPLKKTYTHFCSYLIGGNWQLLGYDNKSGEMDFYNMTADLQLSRILSYKRTYGLVTQGFTTIVPYFYRDDMLLLGYNSNDGTAVVYQMKVSAKRQLSITEVWNKGWSPGWTRFAFFKMGDENFFLKTNPIHNNVNIDHMVDNAAEGSHPVGTKLPLPLDLDAVAAFDLDHDPYFITYRSGSGDATINRFYGNGLGWHQKNEFRTVSGCKELIPVRRQDKIFLMVY